ncbi:MAG TPA: RidA family protein [Amycolatopsis sp.]|nr:RidA family protein [Amycolatopsis sp.]
MIPRNPASVHAPVAKYSHQIEVPDQGRWLVLSGQIGQRLDGTIPESAVEQVEVALANVLGNLEAAGMGVHDVVKLTLYLVGDLAPAECQAVIDAWQDGHEPCITLLYVAGLAAPAFRVEIDAWAHSAVN